MIKMKGEIMINEPGLPRSARNDETLMRWILKQVQDDSIIMINEVDSRSSREWQ
ncbi:MAG: hypothetical protein ACD_2C00201G0002 [uncultured bacterium (gcode 4)]|uniref:Uncharacterized protein n=1 Tax=uncultured bacterium (gcode 4) TaxID=1234023 RepID=K2H0D7_9BACT|nr:MAG: hypothetical protein ACD_2C00201G0002 [uncultured bacterium (gcode 4)]